MINMTHSKVSVVYWAV